MHKYLPSSVWPTRMPDHSDADDRLVKTCKNIYARYVACLLLWALGCTISVFILFFLSFQAHMAAIAFGPTGPMVRGILLARCVWITRGIANRSDCRNVTRTTGAGDC
jgi:hypothetical protein